MVTNIKLHKINKLKKNKEKTRKKRKFENLACAGVYVRVPNNNNDKKKKKTKEGVLAFNFIRELNKGGKR